MAKVESLVTDFSGGLLSRHLFGRADIPDLAQKGANPYTNFLPTVQGPVKYREGFRFVADAPADVVRQIEVSLSDGRRYNAVFYAGSLQVYNDAGEPVLSSPLTTPYLEPEISELRFSSETDFLYVAHRNHHPKVLAIDVSYQVFNLQDSGGNNLQDSNGDQLQALGVYELGEGDWTFYDVPFTSHPFLFDSDPASKLTMSTPTEWVRLESTSGLDDFTGQRGKYIEYRVGNTWVLGVIGDVATDGAPADPGLQFCYVDPVESVLNIQDPSARLSYHKGGTVGSEIVANNRDGVPVDKIHVRSDIQVFENSQVNSWIRVGGDRVNTKIPVAMDGATHWFKVVEHRGIEDHPYDLLRPASLVNSVVQPLLEQSSIYKILYNGDPPASGTFTTIQDGSNISSINLSNSFVFQAGNSTTVGTSGSNQIIGNMSTQRQYDVVEVDSEVTGSNLIQPVGTITVFDLVTDPQGLAVSSTNLLSSTPTFGPADVGRFILGDLVTGWVTLRVRSITNDYSAVCDVLSPTPINELTGLIENEGVFLRYRMGAWFQGNWPGCVAFYEQRRVYGGTYLDPNVVWMSKNKLVDEFDFRTVETDGKVLATTGITYPLSNLDATIRWFASGATLIIGTDNGEYQIRPNEFSAAITQENIRITLEGNSGSLEQGVQVGTSVFFPDL